MTHRRFLRAAPNVVSRCTIGAVATAMSLVACEAGPAPRGTPVPTQKPASNTTARIEVGEHGFEPSRVVVGTDRRLVFRRTSDATCATAVVFPSLGVEKALPLGMDVAVVLPPSAHGEIGFQCGMGMYKSKVVAQ